MTAKTTFKQADLTRALRAVTQAGLSVISLRIGPDNSIEIAIGIRSLSVSPRTNSWDLAVG